MSGDSWEELIARSEESGTSWTPNKNGEHPQTLVGTVRSYEQAHGEFENGYRPWICKVQDRDGLLWSVWLFGQVLIDEFKQKRPMPGERIVLRYCGISKNPKPGRNPANLYRLTVDRELDLPMFLAPPQLEADTRDPPDDATQPAIERSAENDVTDAEVIETQATSPSDGDADDDDALF